MATISNPSATVKIGYNGFSLTGFFIQDYKMTPLGDIEQVTADGRVLCYVTAHPGREYNLTLLVNAAGTPNTGNMEPPFKGQTISITVPATSSLPNESAAVGTVTAFEMICMESSIMRKPGAMLMDLTLRWHPSAASDAAVMNFDGTAYVPAT